MMTHASSSVGDSPQPSLSASTIIAARTCHVLKIDGYSSTYLKVKPNRLLSSFPFNSGGRTWYIIYCPNGKSEERKDFISIYLVLDDAIVEPVMAQVSFSLLDQHGNPVPSHTRTIEPFRFSSQDASSNSLGFKTFITKEDLERSGHLKDDCFSIGVHVVVTKKTPSITVPPSDMHLRYGDLLSSKRGTDVEFIVGGKTFTAHRLVLATRSPVFMAQLFGPMKEGTNVNNVVQIDDMEAKVFEILLNFIYTDKLLEMDQEDEVAMAQHLIVAADKYGLQRLKVICEERLINHIDIDSLTTILVLAKKHNCHGLKEACFEFFSSPAALFAVIRAGDFQYLIQNCPDILEDIIPNIVACQLEKEIFFSENQ